MTIREVQCLLMLYQACHDEGVRRRAEALVPELPEINGTLAFKGTPAVTSRETATERFQRLGQRVIDAEGA